MRINFTSKETRVIVLPDAEDRTIVSSFAWTKHPNVTVRQTDRRTAGQTARGYYSGLRCEQFGRAVKILIELAHIYTLQ